MSRPIEAIGTGAAIFSAAVGYVTVRNQLALLGQVEAVSVIGFFIVVWLAVFGSPAIRLGNGLELETCS